MSAKRSLAAHDASFRSPLPHWFPSLEQCESLTNSCSGRGRCVQAGNRYACKCAATKVDGYTYNWGGVDCSKRDVSWQFNLLLWTSVVFVLVQIAAFMMLFSVGCEPLPGILTAVAK